jgi:ankyrin repeat protein
MVSADPTLIDARSRTGETAILTAVYHRQKEIVNLLVARGVTMSLFEACAAGEIERVERLLASDPPAVNSFSADGWTPLHLAAFFGHTKIAELLLGQDADVAARSRNSNGNTPLHAALAGNHKMVAGLLIGRGSDVNATDAAGWRPLHLAAANNNLDAIKALIAQGADVVAGNGEGRTALSLAQEKNHRETAAYLRRHGA